MPPEVVAAVFPGTVLVKESQEGEETATVQTSGPMSARVASASEAEDDVGELANAEPSITWQNVLDHVDEVLHHLWRTGQDHQLEWLSDQLMQEGSQIVVCGGFSGQLRW